MKSRISKWEERFDHFSLRERLLLIIVILSILYAGFDLLIMNGISKEQSSVQNQIEQWNQQNAEVNERIQSMMEQLQQVAKTDKNSQVVTLKAQVGDVERQLEDVVVKFIKPKQMVTVLRNMLEKEKGLRLIQLKSQAAVALFLGDGEGKSVDGVLQQQQQVVKLLKFYKDREKVGVEADYDKSREDLVREQNKENMQKASIPQVYKHGVLIKMRGTFASTLNYLKSLEKLPWHFYWDAVRYEVLDYPNAEISILVNTLSLDKEWVSV